MNASHPSTFAALTLLGSDTYSLCRVDHWLSELMKARVRRVAEPMGAMLAEVESAGQRVTCLVVPKAHADRIDDYAGELVCALGNAGLLTQQLDFCEP